MEMEDRITKLSEHVTEQRVQLEASRHLVRTTRRALAKEKQRQEDIQQARRIINIVAEQTQMQLEHKLSAMVTSALISVMPSEFSELKIEFMPKRGKTEAEIYFMDAKGNRIDPMEDSGGGPVNLAATALKVSCWNVLRPRSAPVMLLDEPFHFISKRYRSAAGQILREISKRLGIQIILISHEDSYIDCADAKFSVEQTKKKNSVVTKLN